jgi:GT2 family glycosyltransferase
MGNIRKISASIVLYNCNIDELKNIIASYIPSENRLLYLIDNSPQKTNLKSLLGDNKYIYYFFVGENKGYGAGHNIAIRMAMQTNAQYHIVMNSDLQFVPEIIDRISGFMDSDVSIAQVMPKILSPNGDIQYLCKLIPTPIDLIFKRFLPKKFSEKNAIRYQLKFTGYNKQMNVPYLSGCFMFFRISALEKIGLFDEIFFMYPEDIDITRRMHKMFKTMYYPEVSIIHAHAAESYKSLKLFGIHIVNIIKYFNKWGWFIDKERREFNKKILRELNYSKRRDK